LSPKPAQTFETESKLTVVLTPDEYRLALLGLVDFEGHWEILEAATALVVDGPAKAALLRARLIPLADRLPGLLDKEIDVVRLWTARHWFDTQFCREPTPAPQSRQLEHGRKRGTDGGEKRKVQRGRHD
jgi:hypothetical protein